MRQNEIPIKVIDDCSLPDNTIVLVNEAGLIVAKTINIGETSCCLTDQKEPEHIL